jgi:hypothetical protein
VALDAAGDRGPGLDRVHSCGTVGTPDPGEHDDVDRVKRAFAHGHGHADRSTC